MKDLPRVELPGPEADQPAWGKVGIIAILGFAVGVAWPRLAGVSLGPNPPADAPRASVAAAGSGAAPAKTSLSAVTPLVVPTGSVGSADAPGGGNEQVVTVGVGELQKCRDPKGKAIDACDKIALDPIVTPRLKELSKCPSALGLTGKVSVGLDLDFKGKTLKVQRAKAKLPRTTLDGLTRCVERSLAGVSLDDLAHENSRYSFAYEVSFVPPGQPAAGAEPAPDPAKSAPVEGKTARVAWGSCQVRETPKNGAVIGKIPRKGEVKFLEKKDDWYRVEYGTEKKQGWVFGGALDQQP